MLMRKLTWLMLAFALTGLEGCTHFGWVKDGVTQPEANRDAHTCVEAQQPAPREKKVSLYGGYAQNTVITNPDQYSACMAARGYAWRQM